LPKKRRRTRAIDAGIARMTVTMLDTVAMKRLVRSAPSSASFARNSRYHRSVKPSQGNDTISWSLKEKMIRIRIGA
jgi:hypothetical protein